MEENRGVVLLSNSDIPEMARRNRYWARTYLRAALLLLAMLSVLNSIPFVLHERVTIILIATVLLFDFLVLPMAVWFLIRSFGRSFVNVFENGLTLSERKAIQVLRRQKDYYVPFSAIIGIVTNSGTKHPNVALELTDGGEELIDKRDIYDLKAFEKAVEGKVKYLWREPPDDETIAKVFGEEYVEK